MTQRGKKLEDEHWYHGLLPRKEVENVLKNHGDWLVRCTMQNEDVKMVISVRWMRKCRHVMLNRGAEGWEMPNGVYPTIHDLIMSYRQNKTVLCEEGKVMLTGHGVARAKWMIPKREIEKKTMLGEGAYGTVYEGLYRMKNRKVNVALKTCKLLKTDDQRNKFVEEAKSMLQYIHRNVVRLYGVVVDKPPLMLVMEYCPGGGLDKYLEKRQKRLPVETKVRFCTEAARGMEYLASKDCVHRDLAARNCLVGYQEVAKIADFGLSKRGMYKIGSIRGVSLPIRWCAPESLISGIFSKDSDVWTFGMLMWEIFAETERPWPRFNSNKDAYQAIARGERLEMPVGKVVPNQVENTMRQCWTRDPNDRPNMTEVKEALEKIADNMNISFVSCQSKNMTRKSSSENETDSQ